MNISFSLGAFEKAMNKYGEPDILNSDHCSRFTSLAFRQYLKASDIRIGMDGKAAWRVSVFVERPWRTVQYEQVYLHTRESTNKTKSKIAHYFDCYSQRRPHTRLDWSTPGQAYFESLPAEKAA